MSEIPVQVIVAAFQDQNEANKALNELNKAQRDGLIKIKQAAILKKDADGKLHLNEPSDWGFGRGALAGGAVGVVAGILMGPVGLGLLAGALVGGVAMKMHDAGFNDERLRQMGANLKPNSSAIIAIIDHVWVAQVEAIMAQAGAEAVTQAIGADIAKQLEEGRDVIYSAMSTSEQVSIDRAAFGKDDAQVSNITASAAGMVASSFDVNKDKVTGNIIAATDEGVTSITATAELAADSAKQASEKVTAGATDAAQGAADAATNVVQNAAQGAADAASDATKAADDAAKTA